METVIILIVGTIIALVSAGVGYNNGYRDGSTEKCCTDHPTTLSCIDCPVKLS